MYSKCDKKRIYWLMDEYLSGRLNETAFCDEFYYSYDLELDHSTLSDLERQYFSKLNMVVSRFSPYPEDQKLDPNAFSSVNELREMALYIKEHLSNPNL